jgi:hypothetical protein
VEFTLNHEDLSKIIVDVHCIDTLSWVTPVMVEAALVESEMRKALMNQWTKALSAVHLGKSSRTSCTSFSRVSIVTDVFILSPAVLGSNEHMIVRASGPRHEGWPEEGEAAQSPPSLAE